MNEKLASILPSAEVNPGRSSLPGRDSDERATHHHGISVASQPGQHRPFRLAPEYRARKS